MLWFRELGHTLGNLSSVSSMAKVLNYVNSGSITNLSYVGKGNITVALPTPVRFAAFLHVSDGSTITLAAGDKALKIPDYGATEVVIQGSYINHA